MLGDFHLCNTVQRFARHLFGGWQLGKWKPLGQGPERLAVLGIAERGEQLLIEDLLGIACPHETHLEAARLDPETLNPRRTQHRQPEIGILPEETLAWTFGLR